MDWTELTEVTGWPRHDSKDRTAVTGELGTRVLGNNNWERTIGIRQPG